MIRSVKLARRELAERLSFVYPPFRMILYIQSCSASRFCFEVGLLARDSGTGSDRVIYIASEDFKLPMSRGKFIRLAEGFVREAVLHELYESMHLDGRRLYDPHEGEKPGCTRSVDQRYEVLYARRLRL